jgi:hypothetical protein
MPKGVVKTKHDEKLWEIAKGIAKDEYGLSESKHGKRYWASVNGTFHHLKKKHEKKHKKVASILREMAASLIGQEGPYPKINSSTNTATMNIAEDEFLQFTTEANAKGVLADSMLRMDKVGTGINTGADAIFAVSTVWGNYIPSVQVGTKIEPGKIVGLLFKTDVPPDYGHVEEVVWHKNVPVKNPKIISSLEQAKALLTKNPKFDGDVQVNYSR